MFQKKNSHKDHKSFKCTHRIRLKQIMGQIFPYSCQDKRPFSEIIQLIKCCLICFVFSFSLMFRFSFSYNIISLSANSISARTRKDLTPQIFFFFLYIKFYYFRSWVLSNLSSYWIKNSQIMSCSNWIHAS